jgi:uncharacterized membrane protein (UPF0136 family)
VVDTNAANESSTDLPLTSKPDSRTNGPLIRAVFLGALFLVAGVFNLLNQNVIQALLYFGGTILAVLFALRARSSDKH